MIKSKTIEKYIFELSSSMPAPGGGAAAAVTGAQAAALLEMVCNLTIGKKKFISVENEILDIVSKVTFIREKMIELADQDKYAFEKVMSAISLNILTETEKLQRKILIQQALKEAASVPLELLKLAASLYEYIGRLQVIGNPNLISDVEVAYHLTNACILSSEVNVEINLKSIDDIEFKDSLREIIKLVRNNLPIMFSIKG